MKKEVFIYGLECPVEKVIRYVGKSENPAKRFIAHLTGARRTAYDHHTARWIRKLLRLNLEPKLIILHRVHKNERWQYVERKFIATAEKRGWKLTNSTKGGEGLDYLDPVAKAKYRANLSAAGKRFWNSAKGKEIARRNILKAWADPVIAKKIIASLKATYNKPEMKAKMSAVSKEIGARPEVKAIKSKKSKAAWRNPKSKLRATLASPAVRAKMSASAKARWKRPETKKHYSTDKFKATMRQASKKRITKAYRAKMREIAYQTWIKRKLTN